MNLSERYFKETLGGTEFSVSEASKLLNIPISTVYAIIRKLLLTREITKLAPKTYAFYEVKKIEPSKEINDLRSLLLKIETRRFKFTGLCILESFLHHVPTVLVYTLFVERGSSEDIIRKLEEFKTDILIVPEVTSKELELLINKTNAKKILIVKERKYFKYSSAGLASPESAFIDLFFEITRKNLPYFETDLKEIFKTIACDKLVNYSILFNYAHERKVTDEVNHFLKSLSLEIELPKTVLKWISKNI